jgi:ribonuclease R
MRKSKNIGDGNFSKSSNFNFLPIFKANPDKEFSLFGIAKKLDIKGKNNIAALHKELVSAANAGKITRIGPDDFKAKIQSGNIILGKVDHVSSRFCYIVSEERESDVKVLTDDMKHALDGDLVKVLVTHESTHGHSEGIITEVLERRKEEFVGRIQVSGNYSFVIVDDKKIHVDIFVPKNDTKGAKNNDKVVVKIIHWDDRDKNPTGLVQKVLGPAGNNEVEMHSIMLEYGLPYEFPEKINEEAEKLDTKISKEEIAKRRDFRKITTFTIDPFDAKDFDDAISVKKVSDEKWEIGVHIADVSHYIQEKSLLEKEAFERATSVYLVDRVVPMLPEKLSNELCSLRPHEEKLTFSAVFEMDNSGKVLSEWFGRTIIYSDRRFTYEEAQEIIENGKGEYAEELILLNNLAKKLKIERYKKGAISFEAVEVKFRLDEKGKPLEVIPKIRKDAHKLVEEFMLLANKKVAEFVFNYKNGRANNTMVYRTHDNPDPEKIKLFSEFAKKFGHKVSAEGNHISKDMNKLMEDIEGKPEQNVLQSLAVRSMSKAKYTTDPLGHFGLAFEHYSHFTSPIRRYPDLMAHRLLFQYLNGKKAPSKDDYEEKCKHSSDMEKRASDAERASIKYKQAEYMQQVIGETLKGMISGITEWGVYVEVIENKCEGMVRISDIKDDYYEFDADNYRLVGKNSKRFITLGDIVEVVVKSVDLNKRTIDMLFAEDDNDEFDTKRNSSKTGRRDNKNKRRR